MLRSHAQQARAAAPTCVQQVEAAGVAGALARGLKVVGRRQPALPLAQLLQLLSRACMLVYGMRQCACMRGSGQHNAETCTPLLAGSPLQQTYYGLGNRQKYTKQVFACRSTCTGPFGCGPRRLCSLGHNIALPQQPACCHLPLHHARVAMDEVSAQPRSLQCSTKKYKTISRWRC